jgi:hypothetical protein
MFSLLRNQFAQAVCAVVFYCASFYAQADPVYVDNGQFVLERYEVGYRLVGNTFGTYPLDLCVEDGPDYYTNSCNWDTQVITFPISANELGIYLSSYDIQESGSAQAAGGRDRFMVLDLENRELHQSAFTPGITKSRIRSLGKVTAKSQTFVLGDVNGDGFTDIGVTTEEIRWYNAAGDICHDPAGPFHCVTDPVWFVYHDKGWWRTEKYLPADKGGEVTPLPLVGIAKTPVDYVKEQYGNRVQDCPDQGEIARLRAAHKACLSKPSDTEEY